MYKQQLYIEQVKKQKKFVTAPTDLPIDDAIKYADKLIKDETLIIRVDKRHKKLISERAKRAGVPMSAYILLAVDQFAHQDK